MQSYYHHHNQTIKSSITKKFPHAFLLSTPPSTLSPYISLVVHCPYSFTFSEITQKWNHTIFSFLCLPSFFSFFLILLCVCLFSLTTMHLRFTHVVLYPCFLLITWLHQVLVAGFEFVFFFLMESFMNLPVTLAQGSC